MKSKLSVTIPFWLKMTEEQRQEAAKKELITELVEMVDDTKTFKVGPLVEQYLTQFKEYRYTLEVDDEQGGD